MQLTRVDHAAIAVQDIDAALQFYARVLSLPVFDHQPCLSGDGTPLSRGRTVILPVGQSAIALYEEGGDEGIHHLCFEATGSADSERRLLDRDEHLGLGIATVSPGAAFDPGKAGRHESVRNIDHIVIASNDSAATAAHFRQQLGVEIKRKMTRPGTQAHLEFAKLVDVILEFAGPPEPKPGPLRASYWGMVLTVDDIHAAIAAARDAGLPCNDPTPAVQPGAMIAEVKGGTGGVPFAFIQYNARPMDDPYPA